jgi:integrase
MLAAPLYEPKDLSWFLAEGSTATYRAKLHAAGKLRERYSVHDLRHAFAVRLYEATHDVHQVEKALGHATVAVTETYLRSLGLVGVVEREGGQEIRHGKAPEDALTRLRG